MRAPDEHLVLGAEDVELTLDVMAGGRFASLVVEGHELLVTDGAGPISWGCYPMAPFAGRIRDGRFTFDGRTYQLERNMSPHAIHGTVFDRPWEIVSRSQNRVTLTVDLGPGWPFAGRVTHAVVLRPGGLESRLTLDATEPMPAWIGWHPWFRRTIEGRAVELDIDAAWMYERGPDGLPTGSLARPGPPPWDDAFTGLRAAPQLRWAGLLELEIMSTAEVWVVFDERDEGVCVEPQTASPDALNLARAAGSAPPTAEPDRPVTASMAWRWSPLGRPRVRPSRRRPSGPPAC